jgi:predicted transcriptional regulator of viral defense system
MDEQSAQPPVDRAIASLAAAQHGVVAWRQLREAGLGCGGIELRVRRGRLHRVHRGVYAVGHVRLTPRGRWAAVVLACGDGAVLSHRSAAALWGFRASAASVIDVTVPSRAGRARRAGITIHRTGALSASEVTLRDGISVTTPARTLLDLAEVVPRRSLERAIEEAERLRLFDLRALEHVLRANPGRTGIRPLAAVLEEHHIGTTLTRTRARGALPDALPRAGVAVPGGERERRAL